MMLVFLEDPCKVHQERGNTAPRKRTAIEHALYPIRLWHSIVRSDSDTHPVSLGETARRRDLLPVRKGARRRRQCGTE